jgi:putative membrane protein
MKTELNTRKLTSLIALTGVLALGGLAGNSRASDSIMPKEAGTLSHGDKSFIMKAARASTNEVAISQLADSRGSSAEVKSFAQMMITDHSQANSDLQALAMSKGVDITKPVDKGKMDDVSSLSSESGADFDKAYAEKMVSAHDDAVELFKKEASEGKDTDVVAFAKKYVDTLNMHYEHAKALKKTVGQ